MTRASLAALFVVVAGCGGDEIRTPDASAAPPPAARTVGSPGMPEKLGTRPADACGWIAVAEVEAVVGKLDGMPRPYEGGCLYPLPLDSATIAGRAKARQFEDALAKAGMKSDWPTLPDDSAAAGVVIEVDVGKGAEERAMEMGFAKAGSWIGDEKALTAGKPPEGWDYATSLPGMRNFIGRSGTVIIWVTARTRGNSYSQLAELAARVRDAVPDLPFAHPDAAAAPRGGPDPCSVLTREDAEPVLGTLLVAPYRVRSGSALADPGGDSCAYYTKGHHALVVTPHFSGGREELASVRGMGRMIGMVVEDKEAAAADTLEGPWDEIAIGIEGQLAMLKGDRLLEFAHLTSSTDAAGAIRLAGIALPHLAAAPE
jgi:hypothetical protein